MEVAHRIAGGETIDTMQDIRGTAVIRKEPLPGWRGVDSSKLDQIGRIDPIPNPYMEGACADDEGTAPVEQEAKPILVQPPKQKPWEKTYVKLPAFERVKEDKVLYAHASRILHHETNPGCARALSRPTAIASSGSTRLPSRSKPTRWTGCSACRISGCRTRPMATRRSRPTT